MAALFGFDPRRDVRQPVRIAPLASPRRGVIDRCGSAGPAALIIGAAVVAVPVVALLDWLR